MHTAIRQARKRANLTQEEMTAKIFVSINTIRRIETDPNYDPGPEKVQI